MKFTGERVILGQGDPDLLNEHLARYRFAQRFSAGKVVLDAASGSGYGSAMLGENAEKVFGVDISEEAVDYASAHYASPRVEFQTADCMALPFPAATFDLVVAFEIIEHLAEPEAFLEELKRVLSPTGILLLSTPNRVYYTEERGEVNPFHHREFNFAEFTAMLAPKFPHRAVLFQNHVAGVILAGEDEAQKTPRLSEVVQERAAESKSQGGESIADTAHFFVAVCSCGPLQPIAPLLYLPSSGNVLREREKHIQQLNAFLEDASAALQQARDVARHAQEDAEQTKTQARAEMERVHKEAEELKTQLEERARWAQQLDCELAEKGNSLLQLQADYDTKVQWALNLQQEIDQARAALDQLNHEFEDRTAWALSLNAELNARSSDLRMLFASRWYRLGKKLRLSPVPPSDGE